MDFSKLTKVHVFVIGVVVMLLVGAAFWFLGPTKTKENLTAYQGQLDNYNANISTEGAKKADLEKAKQEVREKQALWARTEMTKMPQPPIDLSKSDPESQTKAMIRLWQEPGKTVPLVERFALNTRKVIVTTNFGVPGQPTDPRAIPPQMIEWPLGNITVQGTFPDIIDYMKRWNRANRLVAVDNFQISGKSPFLTGTASVTVYIFPKPNPNAQQPQAGYGGGYGSGYSAGYSGGYSGGPPGPGSYGPGAPMDSSGMPPGGPPGAVPGATPGAPS
jgi:Tfp pilus assembly protein PilO